MKYRPLAPDDVDRVVGELKRLSAQTVLPWQHDHQTGEFYVEVDGQVHPVSFGAGDAETRLVLLLTSHLPLLINAIEGRYVLIDREFICQKSKQNSSAE